MRSETPKLPELAMLLRRTSVADHFPFFVINIKAEPILPSVCYIHSFTYDRLELVVYQSVMNSFLSA